MWILSIVIIFSVINGDTLQAIADDDFVPVTEVTWATTYITFEEMLNDVDLVVYGEVIQQENVVLQEQGREYLPIFQITIGKKC